MTDNRATAPRTRLTLGSYALAPHPGQDEATFYAALRDVAFDAYELPVPTSDAAAHVTSWILKHLPDDRDVVLTAIPSTMRRLGESPGYGLASSDDEGRQAALTDLAVVGELAQRLADASGRRRVVAVEVHSAPGPDGGNARGGAPGSSEALASSLADIAGWGTGARIVVEHCDRLVSGQRPEKGFFSIADEIAAVRRAVDLGLPAADDGGSPLGVALNWGRSAIEARDAAAPVAHARAAAAAGVLRGVMLSGATPEATEWGEPWTDAHIPPRGAAAALTASAASALDVEQARATFAAAAGGLDYVGAKVSARPLDASVTDRVALAEATLALVRTAYGA